MSSLKDLEPGESHVIEEKNYRTGEITSRTTYTKDKITGEIHREVIDFPNDPARGKAIGNFRNSHLRDVAVGFLLLFMISMMIFSFIEDTPSKWNSFFMNLAFISFALFLLLLFIGMIQMNIYERKLRKEMPKAKNEKINWKLADGATLPILLTIIAALVTIMGVVIIILYSGS